MHLDLWLIRADIAAPVDEAPLHPTDLAEAQGYHREAARRRFLAFRGALRSILARYAMALPAELALARTRTGKPYLPGGPSFNLSHTGDHGVLAVVVDGPGDSEGVEVGLDLEELREIPAAGRIVDDFFHPDEVAAFRARVAMTESPDQVRDLFFRIWTRKEAVVKCLAWEVLPGLQRFSALMPGEILVDGRRVVVADLDPADAGLEPAASFRLAVAVAGSPGPILQAVSWRRYSKSMSAP